ncbi:hypothetical protein [Aquimarina algiphila]|uniref:hypothetical protein n=1 Tax=Aquimarina algiphila TaxID=2047982 RepID=UPI00232F4D62|nr:hypothetical protein [Aquimarina algiphila]
MKNLFLIILSLSLFFSCSDETAKLNNRISELEQENKILIDSINKIEYNKIINSELIMIPHSNKLKVNEVNKITGLLVEHQKFKDFNIFKRDTTLYTSEPERELMFKNYSNYRFEFDYTPKTKKDNWIHILAEFDLDSIKVKIPGIMAMEIE